VIDGQAFLFAATRYDGVLTSWTIDHTGLTPANPYEYRGGLQAGGTASITQIDVNGATALLTGGGSADGGLQIHGITAVGQFVDHTQLGQDAGSLAGLSYGQTVTLGNGNQAIYGGITGTDSLGRLIFDPAGDLMSTVVIPDRNAWFAADITAVAAIEVAGTHYVLAASETENGVTAWALSNTGNVRETDSIGTDEGLWIAAPTAMEIATTGGQTYVILASAGSASLSVMSLDATGQLRTTDHIIDSRNSRFDGVSALAVVEHHGNIFVIAGGADDGISLFLLRADGTLLSRGHLTDTTRMSLENISAISAVSVSDGIDIFVASAQVSGITQLHFDTGPAGQNLQATPAGGLLPGSAGVDILTGAVGNDTLSGGAGGDVTVDGAGLDQMSGGAGADTFIIAYDTHTDIITDFELGVDQINLSAWPLLHSTQQLTFTDLANGIRISCGDDVLVVRSHNGYPIDPASFGVTDLLGDARIAQNIMPGSGQACVGPA
jgi:serralysin